MIATKKTLRYFYWLAIAFLQKNFRMIVISFIASLLFIVAMVSIMPYLSNLILSQRTVIGLVGNYNGNRLPDEISSKISSGLIYVNSNGEIIPALASSWEKTDDGLVYRVHLKKNLFWNNGQPFTAKDVNFSFKDVETKVLDNYLIEFQLRKPLAIFPTYLTQPIIRYPLDGVAGLYRVSQFKEKAGQLKEVYLTANRSNFSDIYYRFYDNDTQLIDAYKIGDIRSFTTSKKNVVDIFTHWNNTIIKKNINYNLLLTLFFNSNHPFLNDKDNRQAIEEAIDRSSLNGFGAETQSSIPPISWAYNPNLKQTVYDQEMAQSILKKKEATESAKLNFVTFYEYLDQANVINKNLNEAGVPTNLILSSFNSQPDFDFLLAYFKVHYDPDQYYYWHSTQTVQAKGGNITGYNNKKVDKLLEDGRNTLSKTERKTIYFDLQKVMADDPPAIFLYYPFVYSVERK